MNVRSTRMWAISSAASNCFQRAGKGRALLQHRLIGTVNFCIVLLWPPLQNSIGGYSILPITCAELICFVYLCIYLPETHNRPVRKAPLVVNRKSTALVGAGERNRRAMV
jgi:hypothetical protein